MLREVISGAVHLDQPLFEGLSRVVGALQGVVERGVESGRLRRVDPLMTHFTVTGAVLFFLASAPVRERLHEEGRLPLPLPSTDSFLEHLQELLDQGLTVPDRS
jgi:hypothetical protein